MCVWDSVQNVWLCVLCVCVCVVEVSEINLFLFYFQLPCPGQDPWGAAKGLWRSPQAKAVPGLLSHVARRL